MKNYRKNRTGNNSIIIRKNGKEEPVSARNNWALWKLCRDDLSLNDIQFLISKRKADLKFETNPEKIRKLRTDISILTSAYKIKKNKDI